MPLTVAGLNKQLKNELKNIYLFFGEEKYLHNTYIERIKEKVLEGPLAEFNYYVFDEKTATPEDFLAQLDTYPQMSGKKLIVLKNTDFLCSAEYQKKMADVISSLPDYAVLIFSNYDAKKIKKRADRADRGKGRRCGIFKAKHGGPSFVGRQAACRLRQEDKE